MADANKLRISHNCRIDFDKEDQQSLFFYSERLNTAEQGAAANP